MTKSLKPRRPTRSPEEIEESYQAVLAVAIEATEVYAQSIRHIYYLCSGEGVGGIEKDHGEDGTFYKRVQKILLDARRDGDLGWDKIIDPSRHSIDSSAKFASLKDYLKYASDHDWLETDLWLTQPIKPIIATEKDAIISMLKPVAAEYGVTVYPMKGNGSDTFIKDLASEVDDILLAGKHCHIFYLGDGDPCGLQIDSVPFIKDKEYPDELYGKVGGLLKKVFQNHGTFKYTRIGITPEDLYNPKYAKYVLPAHKPEHNFYAFYTWLGIPWGTYNGVPWGIDEAGELPSLGIDALPAEELIDRVTKAIQSILDPEAWAAAKDYQDGERAKFAKLIKKIG